MIFCMTCGSNSHTTGSPLCLHFGQVPMVKEADPELERLLAEEEEIDRRTDFLKQPGVCTTIGDLRAMLSAFDDGCYLTEALVVDTVMQAGRWRVAFKRISDG